MLILIPAAIFTWVVLQQVVMDFPFGNTPVDDYVVLIPVLIFGLGFTLAHVQCRP